MASSLDIPIIAARPAGRSRRRPAASAPGAPEHSSRTSNVRPLGSSARSVSKPIDAASPSRNCDTSVTVTDSAPKARATDAASSPTGPAPVTSTSSPGSSPARLQPQMPTDSGSTSAPCSYDIESGSR